MQMEKAVLPVSLHNLLRCISEACVSPYVSYIDSFITHFANVKYNFMCLREHYKINDYVFRTYSRSCIFGTIFYLNSNVAVKPVAMLVDRIVDRVCRWVIVPCMYPRRTRKNNIRYAMKRCCMSIMHHVCRSNISILNSSQSQDIIGIHAISVEISTV